MTRVGRFEKVSFDQFKKDMEDSYSGVFSEDEIKVLYDKIELPKRATSGSAGYDIKAPFSFQLAPGDTIKIPTGIRAKIEDGWWLACMPRSGHGFKYKVRLSNTLAVVDSDYYFSDNEGHIFIKLSNENNEGKTLSVEANNSFVQAIFIPYGITYDDDVNAVRNGGIGSTGA